MERKVRALCANPHGSRGPPERQRGDGGEVPPLHARPQPDEPPDRRSRRRGGSPVRPLARPRMGRDRLRPQLCPFLGPLVATLFPSLLALAHFDSWQAAFALFACLNLIQFMVGSYVEPRIAGNAMAISPFIVLFSVFLWALSLGHLRCVHRSADHHRHPDLLRAAPLEPMGQRHPRHARCARRRGLASLPSCSLRDYPQCRARSNLAAQVGREWADRLQPGILTPCRFPLAPEPRMRPSRWSRTSISTAATPSGASRPAFPTSPSAIPTRCRSQGIVAAIRDRARAARQELVRLQDERGGAAGLSRRASEPRARPRLRAGGHRADGGRVRRDHGGLPPRARCRRRGDLFRAGVVLLRADAAGGRRRAAQGRAQQAPAFDLDLAAIDAAIGPRTRLVIVNTPHNPTGRIYGRETLAGAGRPAGARLGPHRPPHLPPVGRALSAPALRRHAASTARPPSIPGR